MGNLIKLSDQEAYREHSWIMNANTVEYNDWMVDSKDNDRFYDGGEHQWTSDELEAMEDRGQYTMTMNISKKAIDAQVGIYTANKPKMICIPAKRNAGMADIASELLDQSYHDSNGDLTLREITFNAYRCNMGFAFVRYDEKGKVVFEKLSYRNFRIDPNSKDAMYRDAKWMAIGKWVPIEEVKAVYNVDNINTGFPYEWNSLTADYVQNFKSEELFDETGNYIYLLEKYVKIPFRTKEGKLDVQIEKRTLIGYEYLWKEILPLAIKDYPIIPLYSTLSDNPYKYSEMHFLRDPQRFINKMANETIRSAQAMSSGKVIIRTSDVPNGDVDAFANNWSLPGAVVELNPGAQEPTVVHPDPLNQAYFSLYQDAISHLHRISLPEDTMGYGESDTKYPNQDIHAKREMVMDTLKMQSGIFETFLKQIGRSVLQHYQAYVSEDIILEITSGSEILELISKDQEKGLDASNDKNIMEYTKREVEQNGKQLETVEIEVQEAKYRIAKVDSLVDLIENYETLDMEIRVVADSYSPTYAASKYSMIERMVEKGALPPDVLVEYSLIPDKEKLMQKVDAIRSLSSQLNQATEQIAQQDKEIKKRDEENRMLAKSNNDIKNQARHDSIYKDERAKKYVNTQQMAMDRTMKAKDLELQIKELIMELQINKEALQGLTIEQVQQAIMNDQLRS